MTVLRQFRIPLILFLLGMIITLIGAWQKIVHNEIADTILYVGIGVECAALFATAIVLFIYTSKNRRQ